MNTKDELIEKFVEQLTGPYGTSKEKYFVREILRSIARMAVCEYVMEVRKSVAKVAGSEPSRKYRRRNKVKVENVFHPLR
jgi:hypothetical protein